MIRLEIEGPGAAEAALVLRCWFNSPYFSRNPIDSARPRLDVVARNGGYRTEECDLWPKGEMPLPTEISLADEYLISQLGSQNPYAAVDAWVRSNRTSCARVSSGRRSALIIDPAKALESIACQFILDDLRFRAPESPIETTFHTAEVGQFDDVLSALLPTSKGLQLRQRYSSNPEHRWLVPRELFPSLHLLLPELCALQPVTVGTISTNGGKQSRPTRARFKALAAPYFYLSKLVQSFSLWSSYLVIRVLLVLPKRLAVAMHKSTRPDRSFQSWRLAERPIAVSTWFRLYVRANGKT